MLATQSEAAILRRVIQPDSGNLSPEVARLLLGFGFAESDHSRMSELSEKASVGTLSPDEAEELDGYTNVSHFLAFVHSKARISLKDHQLTGAA
jgi:hypothetical protein